MTNELCTDTSSVDRCHKIDIEGEFLYFIKNLLILTITKLAKIHVLDGFILSQQLNWKRHLKDRVLKNISLNGQRGRKR